jgi:hypothetical protein
VPYLERLRSLDVSDLHDFGELYTVGVRLPHGLRADSQQRTDIPGRDSVDGHGKLRRKRIPGDERMTG